MRKALRFSNTVAGPFQGPTQSVRVNCSSGQYVEGIGGVCDLRFSNIAGFKRYGNAVTSLTPAFPVA